MSDAVDEFGFEGRQLLNKSKLQPLRDRMRRFLAEHEGDRWEFKELRREASQGKDLSDVAIDERDERL